MANLIPNPKTLEEEQANNFLRELAPDLLKALARAESALFYAKTEGEFDTKATATDVANAHLVVRGVLDTIDTYLKTLNVDPYKQIHNPRSQP
jgi:hypothetical protein